ncbi:MAG TPA: hypothetical protein VKV02_09010, partial [Acidobacteriaceae bacterium]|nr:hypothetical protein [Acidobacteriaceae bacterium]
ARLPACGAARTSATSNGQRQDAAQSARGPVWAWLRWPLTGSHRWAAPDLPGGEGLARRLRLP